MQMLLFKRAIVKLLIFYARLMPQSGLTGAIHKHGMMTAVKEQLLKFWKRAQPVIMARNEQLDQRKSTKMCTWVGSSI